MTIHTRRLEQIEQATADPEAVFADSESAAECPEKAVGGHQRVPGTSKAPNSGSIDIRPVKDHLSVAARYAILSGD